MKRIGSVAVAAVLLTATARMAAAQLPGYPYQPVETGTGISVAADYGRPEGSGASAYGLTGGLGVSNFGISASVGAVKAGNGLPSQTSIGGRLGMKLFGGGLNPITIGVQVGAASVKDLSGLTTTRTTMVLPAAFVRVSPPLFPLKPWGTVSYVTGSNVGKKEVRFTVGANFNLLLGLGVHGGYDWGDSGHTWGVGAHFTFHVPGLGVPGVPGM